MCAVIVLPKKAPVVADHLYTYDDPPSVKDLGRACKVLDDGGLLAYPIDGNWAFGCDAANVKALERLRRLKPGHPSDQPFSLVCSSIAMAAQLVIIETNAYRVLKKALPGPYTILLKPAKNLARQLHDKRKTVGIRIPQSPLILALVERYGLPLATTSVPPLRSGAPAKMGYEVFDEFGHALDLVLDLGGEMAGLETTIVDFTDVAPVLIRAGIGELAAFDL